MLFNELNNIEDELVCTQVNQNQFYLYLSVSVYPVSVTKKDVCQKRFNKPQTVHWHGCRRSQTLLDTRYELYISAPCPFSGALSSWKVHIENQVPSHVDSLSSDG